MPFRRAVRIIAAAALSAWTAFIPALRPAAADGTAGGGPSAVVFAYDRFGEDQNPSISIRLDQFEAHLDELTDGDYHVLPLPGILEALRDGRTLPDRTVAITIDEASRSAFTEAWPRLKAAGLPFTLFVATDAVDRGSPAHMTWAEIRQLAAAGVTIGALGTSTQSMLARSPDQLAADLRRMAERFQAELGRPPALLAYPQGEYSLAVRQQVIDLGFTAAFGQQSGVLHAGADPWSLPRFVMNETYGSADRFELAANALPLPVSDLTPADPLISVNPPPLGFTIDGSVGSTAKLACFATGQGRTALERIAEDRVEVRIKEPFPPGRARVNCTLPADDGRWRWLGVQFLIPE
ncbi:polysaccharide deacetylase family protein [Azospirillum picis]|uniref:Chitooligosaccharide deacetylase n=1 Tax=Azospirillum picis TaxID=488438 RepID=A0ABU0ML78_9PROT|nr:polysaccharide deacetylase family protein [Azospirillum picis]MBP2300425.1 peptidoglycan/xylan/chitin deacetylase (PgdA/CDA1 family) [Azospirillum picis]MDQ0534221.1 peptidoglycan/xylan/chitin deacetylase (PgdA/CDA1 family) [Azospirillum picis]